MRTHSRPRSFCSNATCPSYEAGGPARLSSHGWFRTRSGPRRRRICKRCGTTQSATKGTPYHRMRRPKGDLDRALHMSSEGMTASAIARVLRASPSTVTRWIEKAGRHAQAFADEHDHVAEPVEVQLDEIKTYGIDQARDAWCFMGIEVWSRFWSALHVGKRTLRATLLVVRQARRVCATWGYPILVTTDEFKYYEPTVARVFAWGCAHVQVKNRYRRDRIVRSSWKLVLGSQQHLEWALERREDGTRPNTSYCERINLFGRRGCSYLHRRTPGRARRTDRLAHAMEILRVYYNYIRPHAFLSRGRGKRTPAMAAEIFDRPLSFRAILSWVPRPKNTMPLRKLVEATTLGRRARGCLRPLNS